MAATNKNRKYDKYKIKITYHNGDTEEVKYKSNTDTSNYKEMLKIYRETKEEYLDNKDVAIIDFVGISAHGEIGILFTKEVSKFIDQNTLNNLNRDCREVVNDLVTLLNVLNSQKDYYKEIIEECEKTRDTLLHEVLLSVNELPENRLSLEHSLILKQRENELKRKNAKNNITDLISINKKFNINSAINILKLFSNERNLKGCDKESPREYKNRVEFKLTYRDDIERVRLIRLYKHKYDKMKNDTANKTLYFYNHVGEGKKKKRNNKINKK